MRHFFKQSMAFVLLVSFLLGSCRNPYLHNPTKETQPRFKNETDIPENQKRSPNQVHDLNQVESVEDTKLAVLPINAVHNSEEELQASPTYVSK